MIINFSDKRGNQMDYLSRDTVNTYKQTKRISQVHHYHIEQREQFVMFELLWLINRESTLLSSTR